MVAPLDIRSSARLTGAHRWVEQRLFEILGRWSAELTDPAAQVLAGAQSRHHAWRADLWGGCLPTLPDLDPETVTAPPSDRLDVFFATMVDPAGETDDLSRLVGICRVVLPRLGVSYARRGNGLADAPDAPVRRALRLVRADLARDAVEGERLVQSLLTSGELARRAGERQGWLEAELIAAGGIP